MQIKPNANAQAAPWEEESALVASLSLINSMGMSQAASTIASAMAAVAPFVTTTGQFTTTIIGTVCAHKGYYYEAFNTLEYRLNDFYFLGGARIDNFLRDKGYVRTSNTCFVIFEDNYPVAALDIDIDPSRNYSIFAYGKSEHVNDVIDLCCELVRPISEKETVPLSHYVELADFVFQDNAVWIPGEVHRTTQVKHEYYPYLEGGVAPLMREFLMADENCMVWYGEPGTGKTSAVRGMINELSILPVIAMKAALFSHKNFLRDIFAYSDDVHRKNLLNEKLANAFSAEDRPEALKTHRFAVFLNEKWGVPLTGRYDSRVPVIVIEDADILLTPRSSGNAGMSQLLNEIDGLGTSTSRKIIFTTNKTHTDDIDPALIRDGRSFGEYHFRKLTPAEAIAARAAAGLPAFEQEPTLPMALATALKKPRTKFTVDPQGKVFGFNPGA